MRHDEIYLQFLRELLQAASDLVRDSFGILRSGIVRVSLGEPRRKPKECRTNPGSICHEVRSRVEESTYVNSIRLILVSTILLRYRKHLACRLDVWSSNSERSHNYEILYRYRNETNRHIDYTRGRAAGRQALRKLFEAGKQYEDQDRKFLEVHIMNMVLSRSPYYFLNPRVIP